MYRASLLDRLSSGGPGDAGKDDGVTWAEYLDSIKRDLQDLLNTRRLFSEEALATLPEARRSILLYGLPDFGVNAGTSEGHRKRLITAIESTIATLEPRLMGARVVPLDGDNDGRELRFRVEGFVRTDPVPQRIVFDSAIDLEQQHCRIEPGASTP